MKKKRIVSLILAISMLLGLFTAEAFAATGVEVQTGEIYFQVKSNGAWEDLPQKEYVDTETGQRIFCLESGKEFYAGSYTSITGWDAIKNWLAGSYAQAGLNSSHDDPETFLRGLYWLIENGYPYSKPSDLTDEQARYATTAAIHTYVAKCCINQANSAGRGKFGYSKYGLYNAGSSYLRVKSGASNAARVKEWYEELYTTALTSPASITHWTALYPVDGYPINASVIDTTESGNSFVAKVKVGITNMNGGYTINANDVSAIGNAGGNISGYTGTGDEVLTITIPKSGNANKDFSLRITATDSRNRANFSLLLPGDGSTSSLQRYQAQVGFTGGLSPLTQTAGVTIRTGNYGAPVSIKKANSNADLAGNSLYSLAGAVYTVSGTSPSGAAISEDITTDASGNAKTTKEFGIGTQVTIKEKSAPSCFELDTQTYTITVTENTIKELSENPLMDPSAALTVGKVDFSGKDKPITWSPAVFKVEYFSNYDCSGSPVRTWYYKTGSDGRFNITNESLLLTAAPYSSDAVYRSTSGLLSLPLGSVRVTEVKAPDGYAINTGSATGTIKINSAGYAQFRWNDGAQGIFANDIVGGVESGLDYLVIGDRPAYHRIQVLKNDGIKNGNTSMEGIVISVTNTSGHTVYVKTGENTTKAVANNAVATTITLDAFGKGSTGYILPFGKYTLKEQSVPESSGFIRNDSWSEVIAINDSYSDDYVAKFSNDAKLFGITVLKYDEEAGDCVPQGAASLSGAEITVYNKSDAPVKVNGTTYATDAAVMTITTDENGDAGTGIVLPAGKYELKETKSSYGYKLNSNWVKTAEFPAETANGKKLDFDLPQEPEKTGISIQKVDAQSGNIPQGNTSFEGITFDVILSDVPENKAILFNGDWVRPGDTVMTITTDASGKASTGNILPYAYYDVVEKNAPAQTGMVNSGWKELKVLASKGGKTFSAANNPKMFGIKGIKLDADRNAAVPSGDATLMGAEISIFNRSEKAVYVKGVKYEPGSVVAKMTTTADGKFTTGTAILPYGTYELKETKAPNGYELNSSWSYSFSASKDDANLKIFEVPADKALKNTPLKETIAVVKWDKDKGVGVLGPVSPKSALEGIKFEVINRSNYPVVYKGQTIQPGSVVTTLTTAYDEASKTYRAEAGDLPYGRYDVKELYEGGAENLKANRYYLVDSDAAVLATLHKAASVSDRTEKIDFTDTRVNRLTVTKTVSGNMGNKEKDFSFELSLGDNRGIPVSFEKTNADGTKSSGTATFTGGKYSFTLRHGEQIVFDYIIGGNTYTVTELNGESEGYEVTYTGERTGTLGLDTTVKVKNSRQSIIPTGAVVPIGGAGILAAAVIAAVVLRNRKKEQDA